MKYIVVWLGVMLSYVGLAIEVTSCGLLKLGGHKIKQLLMLSLLPYGAMFMSFQSPSMEIDPLCHQLSIGGLAA